MRSKEPKNLYEPEWYILQLGGKRLRPILTLLAAEAYGENPEKALPAALAVEVFHNFTLLHDDIMDQAPIRRGKPTVHKKWDINTGILSGDVMLIHSYQFLASYQPEMHRALADVFSKTAVEVCEGQQYDMDFESQDWVHLPEYIQMIQYKTAVLLAAALQMGAIVAGATPEEQQKIYDFGIALGLAFQLQDDYLDTFGDQATFGKKIGGDILEHKKTWLYVKATEMIPPQDLDSFVTLYHTASLDESEKISQVQAVFRTYKIDVQILESIQAYSDRALYILENLCITEKTKKSLRALVLQLKTRNQ